METNLLIANATMLLLLLFKIQKKQAPVENIASSTLRTLGNLLGSIPTGAFKTAIRNTDNASDLARKIDDVLDADYMKGTIRNAILNYLEDIPVKRLDEMKKVNGLSDEALENINTLIDAKKQINLKRAGDICGSKGKYCTGSDVVDKSSSLANSCKTKCVAGGLGAAVGGYFLWDAWKEAEEEQRKCLNLCYPEDWRAYRNNEINRPTYKTSNAVSPYDDTIKYKELHDEGKGDLLCTPNNLRDSGLSTNEKTHCDQFCSETCDFSFRDVINGAAKNARNTGLDILLAPLKSVFGEFADIAMWGLFGLVALIVLVLIISIVKK
jgi:hypothetical protein